VGRVDLAATGGQGLRTLPDALKRRGSDGRSTLTGLFQPDPGSRAIFTLLLTVLGAGHRVPVFLATGVRQFPVAALLAALVPVAVVVLRLLSGAGTGVAAGRSPSASCGDGGSSCE